MSDFRKLFPFVRRHLARLSLSLLLLMLAGGFEGFTTALAIPLFDNVLPMSPGSASAHADRFRFLDSALAPLPASGAMQLPLQLVSCTVFKGICLHYLYFLMDPVGQ